MFRGLFRVRLFVKIVMTSYVDLAPALSPPRPRPPLGITNRQNSISYIGKEFFVICLLYPIDFIASSAEREGDRLHRGSLSEHSTPPRRDRHAQHVSRVPILQKFSTKEEIKSRLW